MNIIKISGQYINFDNVTSITFFAATVQRHDEKYAWALTYGYEIPDYERRSAVCANVYFGDGRGEDSSSVQIIDAEPLRDYLNSAAIDLDVDVGE